MKLIAIDMDGTLLSAKHEISLENANAIKEAQEKGHIVMICSGRPAESIYEILEDHNLSCPVAASNGTVVYADEKLLDMVSIDKKDLKTIVSKLDKEYIPYEIYTQNGVFVPKDWSDRLENSKSLEKMPEEYLTYDLYPYVSKHPTETNSSIGVFDDVNAFLDDENVLVQKFFITTIVPKQKERLWSSLEEIKGIGLTSSAPFNIELMSVDGHKGNGVKVMAKYFNVPLEDTVAIGDNFNDVAMFKVAGLSVAMGNAEDEIKEMCDVVTLSNYESGVAHALKKYVLKNI